MTKDSDGCGLVLMWGFVCAWYGFLAIAGSFILSHQQQPNLPLLGVLGFFALAGLLIVHAAMGLTTEQVRFGNTKLELQSEPGVLGGRISGAFRVPKRVLRYGALNVRAANYRPRQARTNVVDDVLWEATEPVTQPQTSGGDVVTLPFSIRLPFDAEPSSSDCYWNVELRSRTKGSATFKVPVARTPMSQESQTKAFLRASVTSMPADSDTKIERDGDAIVVKLPLPLWVWKWWLIVVVVGAGSIIAAKRLLPGFRAGGMPISWASNIYFGITVVVLLLISYVLLSLALTVCRLRADRSGLEIAYGFFLRRPVRVARDQLKDVTASYAQASTKSMVNLVGADGAPMFASLILVKTKAEADWIATELRRALQFTD